MSMLDAFFSKGGFRGAKCKTLLKLTIPRIKLLRNRREIQLKQMRRDIAKLLENGQEATARIRVEHIIREENMMAAQEIIELFCELIAVRLPIIETQKECPLDLKEAISSICFAAPRCSDLPELQQVQMMFAAKYGREFVAAAAELMPDCGVNRQVIELLSIRAPSVEAKLKLLKEIAEEHEVDWDPAASETEFLKPHEDLLNGPNYIISGSAVPKEKQDDSIASEQSEKHQEDDESDTAFSSFNFPEVPKASVRANLAASSAPEISRSNLDINSELNEAKASKYFEGEDHSPESATSIRENKQFIPFVARPPPPPPFSLPSEESDPTSVHPHDSSSRYVTFPPSPPPFSLPSEQSDPTTVPFHEPAPPIVSPPPPSLVSLSSKQSNSTPYVFHEPKPSTYHTQSEPDMDLQDVLSAAQAAAETADRAATAARAAASLAQVRIAKLNTKKYNNEKNGSHEGSDRRDVSENPTFDRANSFDNTENVPHYEPVLGMGDASPEAKNFSHQPQRSVSLEDDAYFSYPNLFTRQDSGSKPGC